MHSLQLDNLPEAVFVSGDEKVQGFIRACYDKGITIPHDIAVVGFDNIPISNFYTPALSTIAPSYTGLATQIIERLLHIINNEMTQSTEVETTFIRRSSF